MVKTYSFLILTILLSTSALGAKAKPALIRKTLKEEQSKLKVIAKDIEKVEKELEKSNNQVLKLGGKKRTLEKSIYELKRSLLTSMANLSAGRLEMKKLLTSIAVNTMEQEESPAEILSRKILLSQLKKRLANYNIQIKATEKQQKRLDDVEQDFKLYESKERMILDLIARLEAEKRHKAETYMETKESYKTALKKWQSIKVKRTKSKKGGSLRQKLGTFKPPVENHVSLDFRKKGVTFLFDDDQPVKAPRDGKVIHKGSLSTYGNVIMIDHGNDTITVCLGDFSPKVQKGVQVKAGHVIGYTRKGRRKAGKLYFEVRQKDVAQPTIHLLDDQALASASNIKRQ